MCRSSARIALCCVGAAAAAGACASPVRAAPARRPNIIFILADDLGYGDLGCYGQKQILTPNLDRMADQGIRFTQCYAGSTVCAPSRCCLMTGLHTGHARVRGNAHVPLEPEDLTVAEVLKEAGYATGIIGKWGLGEPDTTGIPNRKGFDYWFGYLNQRNAHNYWPEFLWKNTEKFPLEGNVAEGGVSSRRAQYSHDLFAADALEFVERHKDQPFFLYLAFTIPHANNEAGDKGMEVPTDEPYSDRPWPEPQRNHAAMITRMDRDIGRLFDKLRALGIDEKTIVFFSSDNGPHKEGGGDPAFFNSSGPLKGYKRALYEGGIRVPGIVRWPGRIKPGQVSDQVWAFWDFPVTAADLAGAKWPAASPSASGCGTGFQPVDSQAHAVGSKTDGVSIAPALLDGKPIDRDFLYWEFHEGGSKQAVRMGDWKAVRNRLDEPLELYDLKTDIGETNNVAGDHPDIVAKIEAYLKTARTESEHWPLQKGR